MLMGGNKHIRLSSLFCTASDEKLGRLVQILVSGILTLYQPMTAKAVMSSHKPIRIYMGNLILGVIL